MYSYIDSKQKQFTVSYLLKKVEQKARHFGQLRYSKMTHVFEKTGPKQDKSKDHGKSK